MPWPKGVPRSEEFKKKQSEFMMGNQYGKGHKPSEEERRRIGVASKQYSMSPEGQETLKRMWQASHTPEANEKRSKSLRESWANRPESWANRKHTEESNLKRSETRRMRWRERPEIWANRDYTGDKNPNWSGGFTPYPWAFIKVRDAIKTRDNHACQKCGIKEEDCYDYLDAHHIDTNKANNAHSNLITLCLRCHGLEHRKINKRSVV